jgi:homoserine O-acetyltransferase/O-succinyltransferase
MLNHALLLLSVALVPTVHADRPDGGVASFARAAPPRAAAVDTVRFAWLGRCPTASGEDILDCRLGYRTLGTLNAARDNAVLIPTWYGGTSRELDRIIGPEAAVDTTRFFAILVDALGNGVSTSPSNSPRQPGRSFPRVTIADMVDAQHRLVAEQLEIPKLHAVVGFSMGGMQALEWAVRYPEAAGAVVSLLGTPRPGTHDLFTFRTLRWMVHLWEEGGLPQDSAAVPLVDYWHVIATSPGRENERPAEGIDAMVLREAEGWAGFHPADNRLALEAILAHDVAAAFNGEMERAAAAVQARLLMVVSPDDRIVGAEPALAFGGLAGAEILSVPSRCGHFALYCEPEVADRTRSSREGRPHPGH